MAIYETYVKINGALRTLVGKEVLEDNIPKKKVDKNESIINLTVTTSIGVWGANDRSVSRMSNAINSLSRGNPNRTIKWKMYDKSFVNVKKSELEEALDLAVTAMEDIETT